jgi:selenocysteine-specific elongation factor
MEQMGEIARRGDFIALSSFPEELQGKALETSKKVVSRIEGEGFSGWSTDSEGISAEDIEALLARGLLLQLDDGLVTTPGLLKKASALLRDTFGEAGFRLGEMREVLGVSRKYALPLAELMDSRGITRRDGDLRLLT